MEVAGSFQKELLKKTGLCGEGWLAFRGKKAKRRATSYYKNKYLTDNKMTDAVTINKSDRI